MSGPMLHNITGLRLQMHKLSRLEKRRTEQVNPYTVSESISSALNTK